jgi:hypothetical protein
MSNKKDHTPGPWVAVSSVNYGGYIIEPASGQKKIALIPSVKVGLNNTGTIAQANARLIAAAPYLLEALQKCLHALTEGSKADEEIAAQSAYEAIRKATE